MCAGSWFLKSRTRGTTGIHKIFVHGRSTTSLREGQVPSWIKEAESCSSSVNQTTGAILSLSENPSSLRQDIFCPDRHCPLDAQQRDRDSTPCGKRPPAERLPDSTRSPTRVATPLLNPNQGSEQYQSMNSAIACSSQRREPDERRLARTAALARSRSTKPSVVVGSLCSL